MPSISRLRLAAPALAVALLAVATAAPAEAGRLRGRAVTADGHGNADVRTRAVMRGPQGGVARRSADTHFSADGSASRQAQFQGANARGSVASSASANRDAAGDVNAARQTTFTSAATGNSAQVSKTSTRTDDGVSRQRSVTCHDAGGNTIACR